jgi:uncharacterized Zn finger protein
MASLKCQQCGSSDINVRNILPKDTPSRIYFLVCAQCGTLARISNLVSLLDHSRQKDPDERSTAHRILETLW